MDVHFWSKNMNIAELESKTLTELQDQARTMGVTGYTRLKKYDLIMRLLRDEYRSNRD